VSATCARSTFTASAVSVPAARSSSVRKSGTESVCGTAWTRTPARSTERASIAHANVTPSNTSSSAAYGEPVPRTRGVSWLPLIATPGRPASRRRFSPMSTFENVRYVGRAWSNTSPSHRKPSGSSSSVRSIAHANERRKSSSRRFRP
jgi:hypothetical protein